MTTKLIQKLAGLSVENKSERVSMIVELRVYDEGVGATYTQNIIYINEPDAPAQLQAAIDKIKEL